MRDTALSGRTAGRRSGLPGGRLIGAAALAYGAFRMLRSVRRELAEFRECDDRLLREWTAVPSPAGSGTLRLHARLREDAPDALAPVVLVHGWGIGSSHFVPLAARLSRHVRVYAPDLPGHGPSDHDLRPLGFAELAEALAAWMDARGLRGAILVGHSSGGQVAAELAARRPDLASALVLLGPTSDPAARSLGRTAARMLVAPAFERPGCAVRTAIDCRHAGLRVLTEEMRQMVAHRVEDILPRVGVPVRVVRGARDPLVSQAWAEDLARRAGAPEPAVVAGSGHAVHYDDPDAVAQLVFELALTMDGAAAPAARPSPEWSAPTAL